MIFPARIHHPVTSEQVDPVPTLALLLLLSASPGIHAIPIELNASFHSVTEPTPLVAHVDRLAELRNLHLEGEGQSIDIPLPGFFTQPLDLAGHFQGQFLGHFPFRNPVFRDTLFEWNNRESFNPGPGLSITGASVENEGEVRFATELPDEIDLLHDFWGMAGFMTTDWQSHSEPEASSSPPPISAPSVGARHSRVCPQWQHSQKRGLQEPCAEDDSYTDPGARNGMNGQSFVASHAGGANVPAPANIPQQWGLGGNAGGDVPFSGGGGVPGAGMGGNPVRNDEKSFDTGSGGMGDGAAGGSPDWNPGTGTDMGTGAGNGYAGGSPGNPGGSHEAGGTDPERTGTVPEPGSFALFALGFSALHFARRHMTIRRIAGNLSRFFGS